MTAPATVRRPSAPQRSTHASAHPGAGRSSAIGGTLLGVFIGIVVGLGLAAGVAYWLMKNNPAIRPSLLGGETQQAPRGTSAAAKSADAERPRFDFYKILPGVEEPKLPQPSAPAGRGDRAVAMQARERSTVQVPGAPARPPATVASIDRGTGASPVSAPSTGSRYWLQAGSFAADSDAENLKARLALAGLEASVEQGALPDQSVRYRVRLGPYDNLDELGRMKAELAKRGFDVAVIRH
jgi:cell division protein FtsN